MAGYVTLMGAEDVRSAANSMLSAASEFRAAASSIDGSLEQHRRFLDDWLIRFTEAMQIASPPVATIRSGGDEAMEASPATADRAVGDVSHSISDRVRKVVAIYLVGDEHAAVLDSQSFIDDLGADSLDLVELVTAIEEEFGLEVPDSDAECILTVGNAIRYVERAKGDDRG